MHDWIDLALGIACSSVGWLVLRLVGNVDALEAKAEKHSLEIRDTRSAVSRLEGKMDLDPFPYAGD